MTPAFAASPAKVGGMVLGQESSGGRIDIKAGEELHIKLKLIAGTGYSWHLEALPDAVLEKIGEEMVPSQRRDDIVGAPEYVLWKFGARGQGTGKLKLLYYRSWEGPANSAETFELTVNVS